MKKAFLLAGLGYGDESKGLWTARLTERFKAKLVVRYNGGAQAGHNVILADGRHHCFSQFGSGTLLGAKTYLSRFMMVNPITMLREANVLNCFAPDVLQRVVVSPEALVTTPYHMATNRILEAHREGARHGSCGMGIGETMKDSLERGPELVLRVKDLFSERPTLRTKLARIQEMKWEQLGLLLKETKLETDVRILTENPDASVTDLMTQWARQISVGDEAWLADQFEGGAPVIFEGAQGVLLDQDFGFHPHTTWTRTTFENAYELLHMAAPDIETVRFGLTRGYATRHGAGPLPTENPRIVTANEHNGKHAWQGDFRIGNFDAITSKYALEVLGGVDYLLVSHLDCLKGGNMQACSVYFDPCGSVDTELFEGSGVQIHKIRVKRTDSPTDPSDLQHQQRLTEALFRVQPSRIHRGDVIDAIYRVKPSCVPKDMFEAHLLGEMLNVPVFGASRGPRVPDHTWVPNEIFEEGEEAYA